MADNEITGRLVLVTGASSGIGAASAKALASKGCHLALTYSSNLEGMTATIAQIKKINDGLRVSMHKVDVGEKEDIYRLFREVDKEHGGKMVDILVSNAGYGKRIVDIWDCSIEEFEKTIAINLTASFLLTKGVVPGMKAQNWGRIIFMSSIAAYGGGINGCHYAASKGGLQSMMKNLSSLLCPLNISVNDVSPALIGNTGMVASPDVVPGGVASIPMGRLGTPEEIANVVVMLATTGFMTGQSLVVAGGLK